MARRAASRASSSWPPRAEVGHHGRVRSAARRPRAAVIRQRSRRSALQMLSADQRAGRGVLRLREAICASSRHAVDQRVAPRRTRPPWPARAAPGCRAPAARRASAAARPRRGHATAAHISRGRPRSPSATARSVPATTVARSLPSARGELDGLLGEPGAPRRSGGDHSDTKARSGRRPAAGLVPEPARHREALVDQRPRSSKRRAVVELVGQAEQHPAAQRAVLGRQPVEASAARATPSCDLAVARRLPQRPWVVSIAAAGPPPGVVDLLGHRDGLLDGPGQVRPVRRPAGRRRSAASGRRTAARSVASGSWSMAPSAARAGPRPPRGRRAGGPPRPRRPPPARPARRTTARPPASAGRLLALRPRPRLEDLGDPGVQPAARDGAMAATSVSRTSAWANRNRSTPSSRTSPATCGRVEHVEHVVLVDVGHGGQRRQVELAAEHGRRPQRRDGVVGQPRQAAGEHVLHAGRRVGLRHQARPRSLRSRASRAYSTRKKGLPSVRSAGPRPARSLGRRGHRSRRPRRPRRRRSPARSRRTACRRASASATSASGPVGSGCGARSRPPAAGRRCAVSASSRSTRRRGDVGPVQVVEDHQQGARPRRRPRTRPIRSRERNSLARRPARRRPPRAASPSRSSTCCHGQSGGAPSSCEQRPTSTDARRPRPPPPARRTAGTCRCPGHRSARRTSARPSRAAPARPGAPPRSGRGRPSARRPPVGRSPARPRRAGRRRSDVGASRGGAPSPGRVLRRTAVCRSRSSAPGSRPSSSASTVAHLRRAPRARRPGARTGPAPAPAAPTAARAAGSAR